jgi:hypothetical protein
MNFLQKQLQPQLLLRGNNFHLITVFFIIYKGNLFDWNEKKENEIYCCCCVENK